MEAGGLDYPTSPEQLEGERVIPARLSIKRLTCLFCRPNACTLKKEPLISGFEPLSSDYVVCYCWDSLDCTRNDQSIISLVGLFKQWETENSNKFWAGSTRFSLSLTLHEVKFRPRRPFAGNGTDCCHPAAWWWSCSPFQPIGWNLDRLIWAAKVISWEGSVPV